LSSRGGTTSGSAEMSLVQPFNRNLTSQIDSPDGQDALWCSQVCKRPISG